MQFNKPFYKKYALRAWLKIYYCLSKSQHGVVRFFINLYDHGPYFEYGYYRYGKYKTCMSYSKKGKHTYYTLNYEYRKKNQIRSIVKFALGLV